MNTPELITALLLGVLLFVSFSRPAFLDRHPMRDHIRKRWQFGYTYGAFAAMGYVFTSATLLLRPTHSLPTGARGALDGAGLILFLIACFHHLPPLQTKAVSRRRAIAASLIALVAGSVTGGFLAVDEVFSRVHEPLLADLTLAALIVVAGAATLWFGSSPNAELRRYVRRRRRARRRLETSGSS